MKLILKMMKEDIIKQDMILYNLENMTIKVRSGYGIGLFK
jgi:hypothetical protein